MGQATALEFTRDGGAVSITDFDEQLLFALPHRQFVFTLPKAPRTFLRYDQRLFAELSRLIFSLIANFCSAAASKPITTAAVVAC